MGNTYSNIFCQEEGVPQGSVLSVTLFVLAINPILSVIPQTVQKNLYVDDLHISCYARNMQLIERQLQTAINNIVEWSNKNGFTISAQKNNRHTLLQTASSSSSRIVAEWCPYSLPR
ncbi:hypothetical protein AVEN_79740-1 [Araneus ventricosus]|uniref:Reverse transcriptase domain-containing protein n=1 Tax=Araneus ventricosus TaxID=182803 RepID=A0A4Y2Q4I6_ARAVE|nr:hypothetical protein AVEN_79740-1 [Araneus ventricosus]